MKAVLYAAASAAAGAFWGAALYLVGSPLAPTTRLAAATLLSILGVVVGGAALTGMLERPFQCDRETPQSWMRHGPRRWALLNGFALGSGFTSRIGFWLWYLVPVGAFVSGTLRVSVAIYGSYGLVRGSAALLVLAKARRRPGWDYRSWLLRQRSAAETITSASLLVASFVALLTFAL